MRKCRALSVTVYSNAAAQRCPNPIIGTTHMAALAINDPRRGRGGRPYRRVREQVLAGAVLCWLCGEPLVYGLSPYHPMSPSYDHAIPLSKGGDPLDPANGRAAHFGCNSAKGNREPQPLGDHHSEEW